MIKRDSVKEIKLKSLPDFKTQLILHDYHGGFKVGIYNTISDETRIAIQNDGATWKTQNLDLIRTLIGLFESKVDPNQKIEEGENNLNANQITKTIDEQHQVRLFTDMNGNDQVSIQDDGYYWTSLQLRFVKATIRELEVGSEEESDDLDAMGKTLKRDKK